MKLLFSHEAGKFVPPAEYWATRPVEKRSGLPSPMLIRDGMEATLNHADGQRYDSKRAYEKAVKAAGCEIVGNDPAFKRPKAPEYKPQGVVEDIKRAIEEVGSR